MRLDGILDAQRVSGWWPEREAMFRDGQIDLSAVEKVDSAGLAFLVKWAQARLAAGEHLHVSGASDSFIKLANLYGVAGLFNLDSRH